jgi:hypothetical protein
MDIYIHISNIYIYVQYIYIQYIYIYPIFSNIAGWISKTQSLDGIYMYIYGIVLWPISIAWYPPVISLSRGQLITHFSSILYLLNMLNVHGDFQYPEDRFIPEISTKFIVKHQTSLSHHYPE